MTQPASLLRFRLTVAELVVLNELVGSGASEYFTRVTVDDHADLDEGLDSLVARDLVRLEGGEFLVSDQLRMRAQVVLAPNAVVSVVISKDGSTGLSMVLVGPTRALVHRQLHPAVHEFAEITIETLPQLLESSLFDNLEPGSSIELVVARPADEENSPRGVGISRTGSEYLIVEEPGADPRVISPEELAARIRQLADYSTRGT